MNIFRKNSFNLVLDISNPTRKDVNRASCQVAPSKATAFMKHGKFLEKAISAQSPKEIAQLNLEKQKLIILQKECLKNVLAATTQTKQNDEKRKFQTLTWCY